MLHSESDMSESIMLVADGLVPIWHQTIRIYHDNVDRPVRPISAPA